MAVKNVIAGEITINTISLYSEKGVLNMSEHVQSITIQESIITPGFVAELVVWDTCNILSMLPIIGTEKLVIEFTAPSRETRRYDLIVTSIKEGEPASNMRSKGYKLVASTPEVVMNKAIQVAKAYNTNVSNMVSDIVKSYLKTSKNVDVQTTKGIQHVLIPSIRPFEAINLLRRRSISISDKSSSYVFFENIDGFHYKTIENLMSSKDVGDRKFINDPTSNHDLSNTIFRNIIKYDQPQQFDIVQRLGDGGISKEIQKFDYKTLTYTTRHSKFNAADFKNADGTLKNPDNPLLQGKYGSNHGSNKWVAHDSGVPDTFLSEGSEGQASGIGILQQGVIRLKVFGDSELSAGQMIEVNINENTTATQAPIAHSQLSGKYLIGSVKHLIGPSANTPRYMCVLECIKGGYKE